MHYFLAAATGSEHFNDETKGKPHLINRDGFCLSCFRDMSSCGCLQCHPKCLPSQNCSLTFFLPRFPNHLIHFTCSKSSRPYYCREREKKENLSSFSESTKVPPKTPLGYISKCLISHGK